METPNKCTKCGNPWTGQAAGEYLSCVICGNRHWFPFEPEKPIPVKEQVAPAEPFSRSMRICRKDFESIKAKVAAGVTFETLATEYKVNLGVFEAAFHREDLARRAVAYYVDPPVTYSDVCQLCGEPHHSRGLCKSCHQSGRNNRKRLVDAGIIIPPVATPVMCCMCGSSRVYNKTRELCRTCYDKWHYRHKDNRNPNRVELCEDVKK